MQAKPQGLVASLNHFFFAEEVPYGPALVRIFLPIFAGAPMLLRFPRVRELYTTDGAPQQLSEVFGQGNLLPVLPPAIAVPLYGIMLLTLVTTILGWKTRPSVLIASVLYVYFNLLDSVSTMTKYSVVTTHLFFALNLSDCGRIWSLDRLIAERKTTTPLPAPRCAVWPARLMQLLFAFMYFGAAITKIQTEAFFSGEQMRYWMLSNWNHSNPIGEWVAMNTPILLLSGYITVVWEIVFGFLVYRPVGRWVILSLGVIFHLCTHFLLGLIVFPLTCISGYLSFVTEEDVQRLQRFREPIQRSLSFVLSPAQRLMTAFADLEIRMPPAAGWTAAVILAATAAAEAEYQFDNYGHRTNGGPMALREIPREAALHMINYNQPIPEADKFFGFDIGRGTLGSQLAVRDNLFESGDVLVAQCSLNPPHEDMFIECVLQDAHGRTIHKEGHIVTRDQLYDTWFCRLDCSLVSGEYAMVLRSAGEDLFRRPFRFVNEACPAPGNTEFSPTEALTN